MGYIDHGNYVEQPIISGPGTLIVPKGMSLHDTYILTGEEGLPFNQIILEEDTLVDICFIVMPGAKAKLPILANIIGERANITLSSAYICGGDEKIDYITDIIHRVPNCISNQIFNGIASGTAQVNFYGKIIVAPDAQKTEAYQLNRNILLNSKAKVNTKPQLEIYADDVKCSHGATIGSLNEDEQFYMRSRGIPAEEAKVLQMISFLNPVLEHIADEKERKQFKKQIEKAIRSII